MESLRPDRTKAAASFSDSLSPHFASLSSPLTLIQMTVAPGCGGTSGLSRSSQLPLFLGVSRAMSPWLVTIHPCFLLLHSLPLPVSYLPPLLTVWKYPGLEKSSPHPRPGPSQLRPGGGGARSSPDSRHLLVSLGPEHLGQDALTVIHTEFSSASSSTSLSTGFPTRPGAQMESRHQPVLLLSLSLE